MSRIQREHPEAREELRAAAHWYDDEQPGLGADFYDAVDGALRHILEWPDSAPVLPGWEDTLEVRSMHVGSFPYRVLYYLTETSIVILAYAHEHRKPGYWRRRLRS